MLYNPHVLLPDSLWIVIDWMQCFTTYSYIMTSPLIFIICFGSTPPTTVLWSHQHRQKRRDLRLTGCGWRSGLCQCRKYWFVFPCTICDLLSFYVSNSHTILLLYYCIIIFTYSEFPDLASATTDQQTSRAARTGQGREKKVLMGFFQLFYGKWFQDLLASVKSIVKSIVLMWPISYG